MSGQEVWRTIKALEAIKPREQVVYFSGVTSSECSDDVRRLVKRLANRGKILLCARRVRPPMNGRHIDRKKGIGAFDFIAVGRVA